jgi:hypothetical protein
MVEGSRQWNVWVSAVRLHVYFDLPDSWTLTEDDQLAVADRAEFVEEAVPHLRRFFSPQGDERWSRRLQEKVELPLAAIEEGNIYVKFDHRERRVYVSLHPNGLPGYAKLDSLTR